MTMKFAKSIHSTITVTTAGTQVVAGDNDTIAPVMLIFTAATANTNPMFVGLSDVATTKHIADLPAGESFTLDLQTFCSKFGRQLKLSDFYIDATTNGEKCHVFAIGK